jgi:competence ComEA-like helix-hairpin-helix protein
MEISSQSIDLNPARIAHNHGYRIEGDTAFLNADLWTASDAAPTAWALQLWACEQPHLGGRLQGVKVAEAPLSLPGTSERELQHVEAQAFARIPAGRRDYAMVLVLASGEPGAFEQVHDFANYPSRQPFVAPHLDGAVGYSLDEDRVLLQVERVVNPRASGSVSGALLLELHACSGADSGAPSELLATASLGEVGGESALESVATTVPFRAPSAGVWQIALLLRERSAEGYVVRDRCDFAVPYRSESPAPKRDGNRLSVHEASLDELAKIPGLSKKVAKEIVRARPFASLDDLLRVRGIGEKTLRKIRALLSL